MYSCLSELFKEYVQGLTQSSLLSCLLLCVSVETRDAMPLHQISADPEATREPGCGTHRSDTQPQSPIVLTQEAFGLKLAAYFFTFNSALLFFFFLLFHCCWCCCCWGMRHISKGPKGKFLFPLPHFSFAQKGSSSSTGIRGWYAGCTLWVLCQAFRKWFRLSD